MISEHATLSKAVRISAGLTQKEIARRCGVCAASIARYERGMNLRDATYKQIDWIYPKLGAEALNARGREYLNVLEETLEELKHLNKAWIRPKR